MLLGQKPYINLVDQMQLRKLVYDELSHLYKLLRNGPQLIEDFFFDEVEILKRLHPILEDNPKNRFEVKSFLTQLCHTGYLYEGHKTFSFRRAPIDHNFNERA